MTKSKMLSTVNGPLSDEQEVEIAATLKPAELAYLDFCHNGFSQAKIAALIGVSKSKVSRIARDPRIVALKQKRAQRLYAQSEKELTVQRRNMIQMMQGEFMDRFREFDEDELDGLSERERLIKLQTRASNATFKDLSATMMQMMKFDHEASPKVQEEQHEFVRAVRIQSETRREEERSEQKFYEENGITEDDIYSFAPLDADGNMAVISVEQLLGRIGGGVMRETLLEISRTRITKRAKSTGLDTFGEDDDEEEEGIEVIDMQ